MLWNSAKRYDAEPFELEKDLESVILESALPLFGDSRIYLEVKRKIGASGKKQSIPDAYLIDLTSTKVPKLYVVENELAKHDPIKHIAVQILEFSLAYESAPQRVKTVVKEALSLDPDALDRCTQYALDHGYENVDYLLERIIYAKDSFNALVIIDEVSEDLETALVSKFKFPVEVMALQRYTSDSGERLYLFDPFLDEVPSQPIGDAAASQKVDPSEVDTIVVPAKKAGFDETFIGEDRWYKIRIHSSMIPKIKYIAAYQTAPISAITHIAPVKSIEQWQDSNKYVLYFVEPAKEIGPIRLNQSGSVKAPQAARYTTKERLDRATSLDEAF